MAGVKLSVDQLELQKAIAAVAAEADGRKLRRDLNKELRAAAQPNLEAARTSIRSMPSQDAKYGDMREAIATKTTMKIVSNGRSTGVNISAPMTGYPRGFKNAPRRFNASSFRHKVFGHDVWVSQTGKPGWFRAAYVDREKAVAAIKLALLKMELRIASRHQ